MNKIVLDTSVAVKWFFKEEQEDLALKIRDEIYRCELKVIVPEFFYTECTNVLWVKYRQKKASFDQVRNALEILQNLDLERYDFEDFHDVALDNAIHYKISVYDAIYVSLAEIYLAPLVTADKALFEACRKRFDFIEYLGDFR